jgi:hypothetical protein
MVLPCFCTATNLAYSRLVEPRSALLERARGVVGSIVGRDHVLLEQLAESKAAIWWHEQLVEGVASLNLPVDMRTYLKA